MPSERPLLNDADSERIYSRRIRPDALDGIEPSRAPTAVFVACGRASSAYELARVRANLDPVIGGSASVSEQELREYHPHGRANEDPRAAEVLRTDVSQWCSRLISDATARRVNVVVEVGTLDPENISALARRFNHEGYQVAGVALASGADMSRQAALATYLLARSLAAPTRFIDVDDDQGDSAIRAALSRLEAEGVVDRVQVVARDGRQLYANETAGGRWVAEPRAAYVLDDLRARMPTARELADTALRWHVLVRELQRDPLAPNELKAEAAVSRDAADARAERDPDAKRLLELGHQADALRSMNRVAFARAYPQHAKVVERLQEAIAYAEQQFEHAADRVRFIEQARQRLADRIAEGRALPAERAKPTRAPRTR